jgi:hypothetical protein
MALGSAQCIQLLSGCTLVCWQGRLFHRDNSCALSHKCCSSTGSLLRERYLLPPPVPTLVTSHGSSPAMPATQSTEQRPELQHQDTLDAPQLVGKLGRNSIAELQPNLVASSERDARAPANSTRDGVGARDFASRSKSDSAAATANTDSDDTIEDYDDLEVDPDTLIANSRSNGEHRRRSDAGPPSRRRRSIQIKLQKTDRKGEYTLTADDPEISDILQKGIERERREAKDKNRTRLRDLVFSRQFTTFDRHYGPSIRPGIHA